MDRNSKYLAGPGDDLMQIASSSTQADDHFEDDLLGLLFPRSSVVFTDHLLADIRFALSKLVGKIETALCHIAVEVYRAPQAALVDIGNSEDVYCFSLMQKSGLFDNVQLLKFLFVRAQEVALTRNILRSVQQEQLDAAPQYLIDHKQSRIAEAAMAVLIAQSRNQLSDGQLNLTVSDVPAEILHDLVWSVVATLEHFMGQKSQQLSAAAEKLLAEHDENAALQCRSEKLAYLLGHDGGDEHAHLVEDGLPLFLARLAVQSGLSYEKITSFTAEPEMARFLVLLRACDFEPAEALTTITMLHPNSAHITIARYKDIAPDEAKAMIAGWSKQSAYAQASEKLVLVTLPPRVL